MEIKRRVIVKTNARDLIKDAIFKRQLIGFYYKDQYILAEPHVYGIKNKKILLLVYQIDGDSGSNSLPKWRDMFMEEISGLRLLNQYFPGKRANSSIIDENFDKVLEVVI